MRIILRPAGVIVIFATLAVLVGILVFVNSRAKTTDVASAPTPVAPASSASPGIPLLQNGDFSQPLTASWEIYRADKTIIPDDSPSGVKQYLRLQFVPEGSHPWSVNMKQIINAPLKTGDNVVFRGWLRSPESVVLNVYIEEGASPYKKSITKTLSLTPEWKEYTFAGKIKQDFASGESQIMVHFGVIPGAVAMADFRLVNYGTSAPPQESAMQTTAR